MAFMAPATPMSLNVLANWRGKKIKVAGSVHTWAMAARPVRCGMVKA